jgi:membrane-bound serine protease (ClpP class)
VSTLQEFGDGVTVKTVTLRKPGLATRFFRLAVTPEAAVFFLAIGLTIAVFEFYALGPGVAAGVAVISLILGGWGLLTLPANWWAVALMLLAFLVLVSAYQRGGIVVLTALGAVILQISGMYLIDGGGQIDPRWWLVFPTVLGVLFFFLLAMPTVQRARLSTETIGRDGLIGESGLALVDFDPDGLVEVRGARWRGTAHREAGIASGDPVEVIGVDGLFLEVDKKPTGRET